MKRGEKLGYLTDKVPDLASLCRLNPINQTPVIHF